MSVPREGLRLAVLDDPLAVCKLDPASDAPLLAADGFFSVTRTADELSVVCPEGAVPRGARCERAGAP